MKENPWQIKLITPNRFQADQEVKHWISKGYGTQFSKFNKQVMIKKGGPKQKLFIVRIRVKA